MTLIGDPEDAKRQAEEAARAGAPRLPEKLRFRGVRESIELMYTRALNEDDPNRRILASLQFVAAIGERLDSLEGDDETPRKQAQAFHHFVKNYKRPKFRRSVGVSQDGTPVLVFESSGSEKFRNQIIFPYAVEFDRVLTNETLEEHYVADVLPWVSAAAELGRYYKFLRAEGWTMPATAFLPEPGPSRRQRFRQDDGSLDDALDGIDDGDVETDAE